jgi:hypothetical protein
MSKIFADGLRVEKPSEKAPDFIIAKLSFKVAEFQEFLKKHESIAGWVNVDLLKSSKGGYYASLNEYKPDTSKKPDFLSTDSTKQENPQEESSIAYPDDEINPNDIPF